MKNISVSITDVQKRFLEEHPQFNFSKYCRILINEYMELTKQSYNIKQDD